jgi:hypothetical protein
MTSVWHHGFSYNELHSNWKWVVMSCTIYTLNCNFAIHATYPLTLMVYKYNELQMSFATQ